MQPQFRHVVRNVRENHGHICRKLIRFVVPSALVALGVQSVSTERAVTGRYRVDGPALAWSSGSLTGPFEDQVPSDIAVRESVSPETVNLRVIDGSLVQMIQPDDPPWRATRFLVPLLPEVIEWWSQGEPGAFVAKLTPCAKGEPHVHLQILGKDLKPFLVGGEEVHGVHATVEVPRGTMPSKCVVDWVSVSIEELSGAGPMRALRIRCPIAPPSIMHLARYGFLGGTIGLFLQLLWPGSFAIMFSTASPLLVLMFVFLTSFLCSCALLLIVLHVRKYCVREFYRNRRLGELNSLIRRATPVHSTYCQDEPCCICLADLDETEALIVLLPCKHVLHEECYSDWVRTPAYPSRRLVCPLCSRRADAMGRLASA